MHAFHLPVEMHFLLSHNILLLFLQLAPGSMLGRLNAKMHMQNPCSEMLWI